jgi:hypothetical protein
MMSGKENHAYARYDSTTTYPRSTLQADIVHIGFGAFTAVTRPFITV